MIPGRPVVAYVFRCKGKDGPVKVRVLLDRVQSPEEERMPATMLMEAEVQAKYLSGAGEAHLLEILEEY